jgi:TRAP-type C4-dicarboxylate transport system permease small subunit
MKRLNLFNSVFDFIELYIPMAAFIALFVSYIILIAYRYIFLISIAWLTELNTFLYLWCVVLVASYSTRTDAHITFPVLYDKCPEKTKLALRLIGNIVIFVMFITNS